MKITCLVGNSYISLISKANKTLGLDLRLYSTQRIQDHPEILDEALRSCGESDLIFIHRSTDPFWDEIEPKLKDLREHIPLVCLGYDSAYWLLSTARAEVVVTANTYLTYAGEDNVRNMLLYLCRELLGMDVQCEPPRPMPWEGAYHPDAPNYFKNINDTPLPKSPIRYGPFINI